VVVEMDTDLGVRRPRMMDRVVAMASGILESCWKSGKSPMTGYEAARISFKVVCSKALMRCGGVKGRKPTKLIYTVVR
jgi:hypothetical protein